MLVGSNLGLVTNGLNGLAGGFGGGFGGYGMYGGGFGMYGGWGGNGVAHAERAKENMQAGHSIYSTQQGLSGKHQAENMAYNQQSANVSALLKQDRTDVALDQFDSLVRNMKNTPQYATYSDSEVRAVARAQYANAVGTDIVNDVSQVSSSNFATGLRMGIPIVGMFESSVGREDAVARLTGTPVKGTATISKAFGSLLPGATLLGASAAGMKLAKKADGGAIAKALASNKGKAGLIAAAVVGAVGVGTAIVKNIAGKQVRNDV
jgi:hypothetical protein